MVFHRDNPSNWRHSFIHRKLFLEQIEPGQDKQSASGDNRHDNKCKCHINDSKHNIRLHKFWQRVYDLS